MKKDVSEMAEKETGISVKLSIETEIRHDGMKEAHSGTADGMLYKKGDSTYLKYIEEIEEVGSVNNVIKMNHKGIVVIRNGSVGMRQKFLIGQTTQGMYDSPFGQLRMETTTKAMEFRWNRQEGHGELLLEYALVLQGEKAGNHTIKIYFKEHSC